MRLLIQAHTLTLPAASSAALMLPSQSVMLPGMHDYAANAAANQQHRASTTLTLQGQPRKSGQYTHSGCTVMTIHTRHTDMAVVELCY
jgi:hypothetical protein